MLSFKIILKICKSFKLLRLNDFISGTDCFLEIWVFTLIGSGYIKIFVLAGWHLFLNERSLVNGCCPMAGDLMRSFVIYVAMLLYYDMNYYR